MDQKELRQEPPIKYPTITIPGRGTFVVKFDLLASYVLDNEIGMDANAVAQKLKEWMPQEIDGKREPGRASPAFMLKVLSACLWDQTHMTPEDLARCFSYGDLSVIATILVEAFSKTQWSAQLKLQETATPVQEQAKPN